MKKTAAIVMLVGMVIAIVGESQPVINSVFGPAFGDQAAQVELVTNAQTQWAVGNASMSVGALILATGLWLFAKEVEQATDNKNIQIAAKVGAALAVIGGVLFVIGTFSDRVFATPEESIAAIYGTSGDWMVAVYTLGFRFATIITGVVILRSGYPKWLGYVMIFLGAVLLVIMGTGGPPGVNNIPFLLMGLTLLFRRAPKTE